MNFFENVITPIHKFITTTNEYLWGYILIALLIIIGCYFTIRAGFVQFRHIREMIRLLGDGASPSTRKAQKEKYEAKRSWKRSCLLRRQHSWFRKHRMLGS